MKLDQRVRQLARHRAQLVRRSSLQRESLQLQWHQVNAPLQRIRTVALAIRLALALWPLIRSARNLLAR